MDVGINKSATKELHPLLQLDCVHIELLLDFIYTLIADRCCSSILM